MRILRAAGLFYLVLQYLFLTSLNALFTRDPDLKRRRAIACVSKTSKWMLKCLNITVHTSSFSPFPARALIVANHVSYIDILILASIIPVVFVTSTDVAKDWLLGTFSRLGGCVFVNRRRVYGLQQELADVSSLLKDGFSVAIFPEGTSSDGSQILPFRSSMFKSAILTRTPVVPLCIQYEKANDTAFSPFKESVFYYGEHQFMPQVNKLLKIKHISVRVTIHSPIETAEMERKDIAAMSRNVIYKSYVPV